MTVELNGRKYWARRLDGEAISVSPFLLLADGIDGARKEMGLWTLAVIGATFAGKPGFVLLADHAEFAACSHGEFAAGGHAEDIQDRTCAIVSPKPGVLAGGPPILDLAFACPLWRILRGDSPSLCAARASCYGIEGFTNSSAYACVNQKDQLSSSVMTSSTTDRSLACQSSAPKEGKRRRLRRFAYNLRRGSDFLFESTRNPLKSLDSKK